MQQSVKSSCDSNTSFVGAVIGSLRLPITAPTKTLCELP
jgi:hypothetical protein